LMKSWVALLMALKEMGAGITGLLVRRVGGEDAILRVTL